MNPGTHDFYRFGRCIFNADDLLLERDDVPVKKATRRLMQVLKVLIEARRAGRKVVGHNDIISKAWAGDAVSTSALTVAVCELNKCLKPDASIENAHGIAHRNSS